MFIFLVRPLAVRITEIESIVANQRHDIECIAMGSRPPAMITWWIGSPGIRQLTDVTVVVISFYSVWSQSHSMDEKVYDP